MHEVSSVFIYAKCRHLVCVRSINVSYRRNERVKLFSTFLRTKWNVNKFFSIQMCRRDNVITERNFEFSVDPFCCFRFSVFVVVAVNKSTRRCFTSSAYSFAWNFTVRQWWQQSISLRLCSLDGLPPRPERNFVRSLAGAFTYSHDVHELKHTWELSNAIEKNGGKKTFWFNFICSAPNSLILIFGSGSGLACEREIHFSRSLTATKKKNISDKGEKGIADGCWLPHTCFVLPEKVFG